MTRVKVVFQLQRDEDGYPPVDLEGLWAELIDESTARIDNIPFFSREVALGDIVKFAKVGDEFRYTATVEHSGNSLVRVVYYSPVDPAKLRRQIDGFGCETELDEQHTLIAVSVPPAGDLHGLQEFLQVGETRGEVGYEEALLA